LFLSLRCNEYLFFSSGKDLVGKVGRRFAAERFAERSIHQAIVQRVPFRVA
jgi:hypothetical protein